MHYIESLPNAYHVHLNKTVYTNRYIREKKKEKNEWFA